MLPNGSVLQCVDLVNGSLRSNSWLSRWQRLAASRAFPSSEPRNWPSVPNLSLDTFAKDAARRPRVPSRRRQANHPGGLRWSLIVDDDVVQTYTA